MTEPVPVLGGGIIVPWDDKQPIKATTWAIKIGDCPVTEHFVFEECLDYGIKDVVSWAEEHWLPIRGKRQSLNGPAVHVNGCAGGPGIYRGTVTPGVAIRLRITEGTGVDIPVHVQVGRLSYVGNISSNAPFTFVIDEEMTLEDLLSD
jgi:hypothetical protein